MKFPKICSRPCLFVNQEIKDLMKCKNGLKWFLQTQDAIDWANFKESYNLVKKTLLEAERNHTFEEVKLHQKNHGSLWKIINHALLLKMKERQIYSKDLTSTANEFNQFFRSCWKKCHRCLLAPGERKQHRDAQGDQCWPPSHQWAF